MATATLEEERITVMRHQLTIGPIVVGILLVAELSTASATPSLGGGASAVPHPIGLSPLNNLRAQETSPPMPGSAATPSNDRDGMHATVTVVSNVSDYQCALDGQPCGQDHGGNTFYVPAGKHVLTLNAPGYIETSQVFAVAAGATVSVVVVLLRQVTPDGVKGAAEPAPAESPATVAPTGSVTIVSNVGAYNCALDARPCGQDANGAIVGVPEGKHILVLGASGYAEASEVFEVTAGRDTRVLIPLQRKPSDGGEAKRPEGPRFRVVVGMEPSFAYVLKGPPPDPMPSDRGFYVRRANFGLGAKVAPWVGFRIGFEYTQLPVSRSLDILERGPLRDALVWLRVFGHELRLGQFRLPFGWEAYFHSIDLPVTNRSITYERITAWMSSDVGVSIIGEVPLGDSGWSIEDGFSVTNGLGFNKLNSTGKVYFSGRLAFSYKGLVGFGFSGQTAKALREDILEETTNLGTHAVVDLPWILAVVEGGYAYMSKPIKTKQNGFYTLVLAKLPFGFKLGARFEYLDVDTNSAGNERRIVGVINYVIVERTLDVLINYEHDMTWRMPEPWYTSVIDRDRIPPADTLRVGLRLRLGGSM